MKKDHSTQELALVAEGSMTNSTLEHVYTTPLWDVLTTTATTAKDAAQTIVRDKGLLAMAREYAPTIARAAHPAGAKGVQEALAPIALAFDAPKKHAGEMAAFVNLYVEALRHLPLHCIRAAVLHYIHTTPYNKWPTVGDLRIAASKGASDLQMADYRLKKALEAHVPPPPPTAAEKAEVARMMAELPVLMARKKADVGNLSGPLRPMPGSPQQVASQLRAMADRQAVGSPGKS